MKKLSLRDVSHVSSDGLVSREGCRCRSLGTTASFSPLGISPVLSKHQNLVTGPDSSSATDLLCGPGGSLPPRALFPHVYHEDTGAGHGVQMPVSPAGVSWAVAVTE